MRGWEIGGHPEFRDEDEELMNLEPDRTKACFNCSDLENEDDEKWRNWRGDDPEPDTWGEWDADGEQAIAHAFFPC